MKGIFGPYINQAIDYAEDRSGASLSRNIARLYSNHSKIAFGSEGLASWSSAEMGHNLEEAQQILVTGLAADDSVDCSRFLRRAGEMYEWSILSSSGEERDLSIILAGTCYLLAGYPARASGVLTEHELASRVSIVLRLVLRGHFHDALEELTQCWVKEASEHETDGALLDQLLRSMGIALAWLRWGEDPRLELAMSTMKNCARAFRESADGLTWLLAHAFVRIFDSFNVTSLRTAMQRLNELVSETGRLNLERYVRSAFTSNRFLAWPSQLAGISAIAENRSFALCTPTGSGKTRVAEVLIARHLFPSTKSDPDNGGEPFILYLAPSRALSAEVEATITGVIRSLEVYRVNVSSLYGGGDFGPSDLPTSNASPSVLISTHEKAEALLRFIGPSLVDRISCVVIDEAHSAKFSGDYEALEQAQDRSLKLESLINRLKAICSEDVHFVALSAVAVGFRDMLASWVTGTRESSPVVIDYRSTRQLLGRLVCYPTSMTIEYDVLDGQRLTVGDREDSPYIDSPFPVMPSTNQSIPVDASVGIRMRAQLLWAAINLAARTGSKNHSVLISITEHIDWYAKSFLDLLLKDWANVELPTFFVEPTQEADIAAFNRCKASCADYFGSASREYQLLELGIVLHHGKMPSIMAKLVLDLIRARVINIVLATSTLSEGVNLPVETVLIPSITRRRKVDGRSREFPIPAAELANLIGRAGRPGVATEGKALVLMSAAESTAATKKGYNSLVDFLVEGPQAEENNDEQSPLLALILCVYSKWTEVAKTQDEDLFIDWLESISITNSNDDDYKAALVLDTLDQQLLNVLEENESRSNPLDDEEAIAKFWRGTLAQFEAEEDADTIETCLKRRARSLKNVIYPERSIRKALYSTGLPPKEGLVLIDHLNPIKDVLLQARNYATWDHAARLSHFHELIKLCTVIDCFDIPDLRVGRSSTPWLTVFEWWMAPKNATKRPSPASVSRWYDFAAKHFIFKLNWALGSILGSLLERDGGDGEILDRWSNARLPWTAMWYKDMISWGIMDPVASYAMSRKIALTRYDALKIAADFWQPEGAKGDNDLIPTAVSDWMDARTERSNVDESKAWVPPTNMPVTLMEDLTAARSSLRVLPAQKDDELIWVDPAGYALARSSSPKGWTRSLAKHYDFLLDPFSHQVNARPYASG